MVRVSIFLPSPLWERVAPNAFRRRVEGFLRLGELCEKSSIRKKVVACTSLCPVPHDPKTLVHQHGFSRSVTLDSACCTAIRR